MTQDPTHKGSDLLAIGFGASVVLWAACYLGLAPAVNAPPLLMALIVVAGIIAAGLMLGRWTQRGVVGGVKLGITLGLINFILVASLQSGETTGKAILAGLGWVIGFTAVAIVFCAIGAWIGSGTSQRPNVQTSKGMHGSNDSSNAASTRTVESHVDVATFGGLDVSWTSAFALIVAITTLPLIVSGGVVTGLEAGMAVPDWLTTFGYPMMFYPLALMQEDAGVYAEHFHRLWGLLVGLSVICLMVQLFRVDARAWVRALSAAVLLAVIVQGVLGGTRITEDNITLAIVHGVFGQIVFASIAVIAACTSMLWLSDRESIVSERGARNRRISIALLALLVVQLLLGAIYRHLRRDAGDPMHGIHAVYTHIFLAFVVAVHVIIVGGRAWACWEQAPGYARIGKWLITLIGVQIILGFAALVAVLARGDAAEIPVIELTLTTAHQVIGAVILALAALAAVWTRRLFAPPK